MLLLLEQGHIRRSQAQSPCKKIFTFVQRLGKCRTENMVDKAKHHSFLEMALQGSNPADSWTYRDEDFGGFLSHLAKVRGGSHNPHSIGMRVLNNFRAKALPRLKSK